ncbi:MAG: hypothetical protein BWK74_02740 [Desulfobacteraceae bacterium A6]|nr:MAG: hypothetical protein BWK74_02740 [Desulfobacteraceae bacterium A6]
MLPEQGIGAEDPLFAGIDVGSLTAKCVLISKNGIHAYAVMDTGTKPNKAGETVFAQALDKMGARKSNVKYSVGTGYGRISLSFVDMVITELTCHACGAHYLDPEVRTVIDIGGQDSKVIRLNTDGSMSDFIMNDKCAAGTGRFLQVMAQALETELEDLGEFSLTSTQPSCINNICTVFAESEVISLLASGETRVDIAAGLNESIARRVGLLANRIGLDRNIAFVGGVAKNIGLRMALEKFLGKKFVSISQDPQITAALGASLIAREGYRM